MNTFVQAGDALQREALEKIRQATQEERDKRLLQEHRQDVAHSKIYAAMRSKRFGTQLNREEGIDL